MAGHQGPAGWQSGIHRRPGHGLGLGKAGGSAEGTGCWSGAGTEAAWWWLSGKGYGTQSGPAADRVAGMSACWPPSRRCHEH